MPNSTEFRLVIQTSTIKRAHSARLANLRALRGAGREAALSTLTARSSTSAFASRAASAAADSASSATDLVPSAIVRSSPETSAKTRDSGANQSTSSLASGERHRPLRGGSPAQKIVQRPVSGQVVVRRCLPLFPLVGAAVVRTARLLAAPLRHTSAFTAGLGGQQAVLGEAAGLGCNPAPSLAAGFGSQGAVLREAALLARHIGAALAGEFALLGGLHASKTAGRPAVPATGFTRH